MHAAGFVAEHAPNKQTLIDLDAGLCFLPPGAPPRQIAPHPPKPRHCRRGIAHQILDTLELRTVIGQAAIKGLDMDFEKLRPRGAIAINDGIPRRRLSLRACGFGWQPRQKVGAEPPTPRISFYIAAEISKL